jgi:transcriptional regulator with XRE-family HTH domain
MLRKMVNAPIPRIPRYPDAVITPSLMRAARALLGWNQQALADAAGMSVGRIKDVERGSADPRASELATIEKAFADAGVIVLEAGDVRDGGQGVRYRS